MNESSASSPPATPCLIRRARAGDTLAIDNLYRQLIADPQIHVLPEQVESLAQSPTSFLFVAEAEARVCGTVLLTICPDVMFRAQPFGIIENLVVAQDSRGGGIGRALLAQVEQTALANDCTKLMLLSSTTRAPAHALFHHCGYTSDTKHGFVKYRRQFASAVSP